MADDSVEVIDDFPFHPTDSPRGMRYYDTDILTEWQQTALNDYKRNANRHTEEYLNNNPVIRALVAMIYRVILAKRPRDNLHLTLAEYFSKPRSEIEDDVKAYLKTRVSSKEEDFIYTRKPSEEGEFEFEISEAESVAAELRQEGRRDVRSRLTKLSQEAKEFISATMKMDEDNFMFVQNILKEQLDKKLDQVLAVGARKSQVQAYEEIDEQLIQLNEDIEQAIQSQSFYESKFIKDQIGIRKKTSIMETEDSDEKLSSRDKLDKSKKRSLSEETEEQMLPASLTEDMSERQWLRRMTEAQIMKDAPLTETKDSYELRKWRRNQMIAAEEQWVLLQTALRGEISPDVQDGLRQWQLKLMESAENMSPEMKEAQMEWLESQMSQGTAMTQQLTDILSHWQVAILNQSRAMTLEMQKAEVVRLQRKLNEIDNTAEEAEEMRTHILGNLAKMDDIEKMTTAIYTMESEALQNEIDMNARMGFLSRDALELQMQQLDKQKDQDDIAMNEYDAKMRVLDEQMDIEENMTYERLIAHKRWLNLELLEDKITPESFNIQKHFVNTQINLIGRKTSEIFETKLMKLEGDLEQNLISQEEYDGKKQAIESKLITFAADTVNIIVQQLQWLEIQTNKGNLRHSSYQREKDILTKKFFQATEQTTTANEIKKEMKVLDQEFNRGFITDDNFKTKRLVLEERLETFISSPSQVLLRNFQLNREQRTDGFITENEFKENQWLFMQVYNEASFRNRPTVDEKDFLFDDDEPEVQFEPIEEVNVAEEDSTMADFSEGLGGVYGLGVDVIIDPDIPDEVAILSSSVIEETNAVIIDVGPTDDSPNLETIEPATQDDIIVREAEE